LASARFGAVEPRPGQREELADATGQPRQIPAAADIGEQADTRFGHGKARIFGRDAIFARQRQADATAHGDAVHERDDWLGIGEQRVVHAIFGAEEIARGPTVAGAAFGEQADIAAGAKAAALAMVDDHDLDRVVAAPSLERGRNPFAHGDVERVDRAGAIEADNSGAFFNAHDQVVGHALFLPRAMARLSARRR